MSATEFPQLIEFERFNRTQREYAAKMGVARETFGFTWVVFLMALAIVMGFFVEVSRNVLDSRDNLVIPFVFSFITALILLSPIMLSAWQRYRRAQECRTYVANPLFQHNWKLLCQMARYNQVLASIASMYLEFPRDEPHLVAICQIYAALREELLRRFDKRFPIDVDVGPPPVPNDLLD